MHCFLSFIISFSLTIAVNAQILPEKHWPDELNTAKNQTCMSELEQQVIHELNKVRSNPAKFAEDYMEELLDVYQGKLFYYPGQDPVKTKEGIFPLEECLETLKKTAPMPLLYPAHGLVNAAGDLVADQQKHGGIGHISRSGTTPQQRIEKFGDWDICSAEDITYGSFEARQIVIFLLIDDGVPDRGHRKNILNPCFRFGGVRFGKHPTYETMCVIDYAGDYKTKALK